jgi:hypothetical protein
VAIQDFTSSPYARSFAPRHSSNHAQDPEYQIVESETRFTTSCVTPPRGEQISPYNMKITRLTRLSHGTLSASSHPIPSFVPSDREGGREKEVVTLPRAASRLFHVSVYRNLQSPPLNYRSVISLNLSSNLLHEESPCPIFPIFLTPTHPHQS